MVDAGKKFLSEFIDCYEVGRSLWDSSSTEYNSRHTKLFAYNQLLRIMKKYKKDATITDVKKKINTLRSNFRREMKRISMSESRGDNPLYTPNLWWFEKFSFLRNLKSGKQNNNNNNSTTTTTATATTKHEEVFLDEYMLDDDEEETQEEEEDPVYNLDVKYEENKSKRHLVEETYIQPMPMPMTMPMPMPMPKKIKIHDDRDRERDRERDRDESMHIKYNVLPTATASSSSDGDTFDHMCKAWAGNLREMDKTQRIIAGRAISEIIFQGQIGALTFDSIPKMSTNTSFSSPNQHQQMISNNTRITSDPIAAYSSNKSQDLDYRQSSRRQSRDSSPKPMGTFSSVTSSNNQHITHGSSSTSSQPQKTEYHSSTSSSSMEQQSFSTIQQSGQFYNQ